MKRIILMCVFFALAAGAENAINLSVGPIWPTDNPLIENSEQSFAWNAAAEWAFAFDNHISIGAKMDLLWHVTSNNGDTAQSSSDLQGISKIESEQRIMMFPLSAFIQISPIPQYRLHPVIRGQVGYNSMTVRHTDYSESNDSNIDKVDGYYYGVSTRLGVDAVYDIGPKSSLFTGFEYHFSKLRNDYELDMNAPAIRMGLSVYY
ncbi:MAG: hypothetical protein ACQEQV_09210 [Fibrobacterota bacterium]